MMEMTIQEEINMLRRSVLIHSCLYYFMNTSVISDVDYDVMARRLDWLHKAYPDVSETCVYQDAFKNFSPASGYDLPYDDGWVVNKALYIYRICQEIKKG